MKLLTTTCAEVNLTLVLPDKYNGADQATLRQAITNDEATLISVEMPTPETVYSIATSELDSLDLDTSDSPLTDEETEAISSNFSFIHYYS